MRYFLLILKVCSITWLQAQNVFPMNQIQVVVDEPHSFLRDHGRLLQTIDGNGNIIDSEILYSDAGSGTSTHLFIDSSVYIIVDANGMWFSVDFATGQIIDVEWRWQQPLPKNYYGQFIYSREGYVLEKRDTVNPADVYLWKDPR